MSKHVLMRLLLLCLVATGGCAFGSPPKGVTKSLPTPAPTNTVATSGPGSACPQLTLAKPGAPPAAPPSVYVTIVPSLAASSSRTAPTFLAALNPKDGSIRWKVVVSRDWLIQVENVVVACNVVYAAINQVGPRITGILVALNAKDGALRWCVPLVSPEDDSRSSGRWHVFAADEQTVYVAKTVGGPLLALKSGDGSIRWSTPYGIAYYALAAANGLVFVMLEERTMTITVLAAHASDGTQVWRFQPRYSVGLEMVLADGILYVTESGLPGSPAYLDEVDASTGALLAQRTLSVAKNAVTSLVVGAVVDGTIYAAVSTVQKNLWGLMAFEANGVKQTWELPKPFAAGPAVADGMVYLCEMGYPQSRVSALNAKTGESLWDQVLPDQAPEAQVKPAIAFGHDFAEPLVLNGLVDVGYRADEGGTLIPVIAALDGKTGALEWRLAYGVLLAAA